MRTIPAALLDAGIAKLRGRRGLAAERDLRVLLRLRSDDHREWLCNEDIEDGLETLAANDITV